MEYSKEELIQQLVQEGCPICMDVANEPVETECCHHYFCKVCLEKEIKARGICCYCRRGSPKFKLRTDLHEKLMMTPLPCPNRGCERAVIKRDLEKHSTKECDYAILSCLFCRTRLLRKEYIQHAIKNHNESFRGLMVQHSTQELPPKLKMVQRLLPNISFKFDPLLQKENKAGRMARRGTTGNYYCRAPLGLRGCSCDGNCGPNNGCSCVDCMRLTLEAQNIYTKNILVNSEARLVKVEDKKVLGCFYQHSRDVQCIQPNLCSECRHLAQVVGRYESLME